MNNAKYHADPAVSASHLHAMAKSPAHYYARYLDPNRPPFIPTVAMKFGSLVHCAVLEPANLGERYGVCPSRSTKNGKAIAQQMDSTGVEAVTQTDWDAAQAMAATVRKHPIAGELLSEGEPEQPFWWYDGETGQQCKCRPDWIRKDSMGRVAALVDLKTTQDASPKGFAKSIATFRYHVQAAHYKEGLFQLGLAEQSAKFIFIAIEKVYPYATATYELDEDSYNEGWCLVNRDLRRIAYCREHNEWPGYSLETSTLSLPRWAYNDPNITLLSPEHF